MYIKFLPKVRGGAQKAEGSVVLRATAIRLSNVIFALILGRQFNASVLNQNKDARAVRPYLTSVFHHSWQLFSVLYSSTFDHCVERSQSATMTFPSWLMMDHDLPFSIFVSPSEKSVIQL